MAKRILLLFVFLGYLNFDGYPQSLFNVEVNFSPNNKIKDGERIYLREAGKDNILAEGFTKSNKAILKGSISKPSVVMLHSNNRELIKGVKILLENTNYTTEIDTAIKNSTRFITESTFHNVWKEFVDKIIDLEKEKNILVTEYNKHSTGEINERNTSFLQKIEDLDKKKKSYYKELGRKHPTNLATVYILSAYYDMDEEFKSIYDSFSPELKNSTWGEQVEKMIFEVKKTEENASELVKQYINEVENFEIEGLTTSNKKVIISPSYIADQKFKVTVLDFWASWCGPCRIANNDLFFLYNRYNKSGLNIVAVSMDANKEAWLKASEKDNIIWENVISTNHSYIREHFSLGAIPFNLIINGSGEIIDVNVHDIKKLTAIIENELKEKKF